MRLRRAQPQSDNPLIPPDDAFGMPAEDAAAPAAGRPRAQRQPGPSAAANLRPTLIVGLGGTGYKIAVALKARLLDQYGSEDEFSHSVRFLCMDTANENFTAMQPNHPERGPVGLSRGTEFLRISDVPLYELLNSRANNPAIAKILPSRLQSTHIDQGAQQVRRLGRIALFYHYNAIREAYGPAIRDLLTVDAGQTGSAQRAPTADKRLRVYIICSICGGTGAGTFIDMAYLLRHLAVSDGGVLSPRNVEVVGLLMLPEAFPEIKTTGADRIRANAYASLLDMEYYNQDVGEDEALYDEELPGGRVRVSGTPFTIAYLLSSINRFGTVNGLSDLAPILADALQLMIASRVGEQHDATLDNVKVTLTGTHRGYRTFYSALGISQIVYPRVWLRQRFGLELKQRLLNEYILREAADAEIVNRAVQGWLRGARQRVGSDLQSDVALRAITAALSNLRMSVANRPDPTTDLSDAFYEARRRFQADYEAGIERRTDRAANNLARHLRDTVDAQIDRVFRSHPPEFADDSQDHMQAGLRWAQAWLAALDDAIYRWLDDDSTLVQPLDYEAELSRHLNAIADAGNLPLFSRRQLNGQVRKASTQLEAFFQGDAARRTLERAERDLFEALLVAIQQIREELDSAITYWEIEQRRTQQATRRPFRTPVTQWVMSQREIETHLRERLTSVLNAGSRPGVLNRLMARLQAHDSGNDTPRSLSLSLEPRLQDDLSETMALFGGETYDLISGDSDTAVAYLLNKAQGQREEMIGRMSQQAAPFLVFNEGETQAIAPPKINVIGVDSADMDQKVILESLAQPGDVSFVSTHDASRVIMLASRHGIPALALSTFNEYRLNYETLTAKPNTILHMNNTLEREPYDPGSYYFINFRDFELTVARALAYGWIIYNRNLDSGEPIYSFSPDFYQALMEALNYELRELRGRLEAARARHESRSGAADASETLRMTNDISRLQGQYDEVLQRTLAFNPAMRGSLDYTSALGAEVPRMQQTGPRFALALPNADGSTQMLANSLDKVLQTLNSGVYRMIPAIFQRVFRDFYERETNIDPDIETRITLFLEQRNYVPHDHDDTQRREQIMMRFGYADHDSEERFCSMLAAYETSVVRQRRVTARMRGGYYGGRAGTQNGARGSTSAYKRGGY